MTLTPGVELKHLWPPRASRTRSSMHHVSTACKLPLRNIRKPMRSPRLVSNVGRLGRLSLPARHALRCKVKRMLVLTSILSATAKRSAPVSMLDPGVTPAKIGWLVRYLEKLGVTTLWSRLVFEAMLDGRFGARQANIYERYAAIADVLGCPHGMKPAKP